MFCIDTGAVGVQLNLVRHFILCFMVRDGGQIIAGVIFHRLCKQVVDVCTGINTTTTDYR